MKVQDIVERLTILGLDETEAAVYVHLSMMGPSKASDVAASLKLHRTEAYRTLQNLVQRGFASATLGRPSKFVASQPEKLFQEILAAHEARSESIKRAQDEIGTALTTLRGQPAEGAVRNTFKLLQGRREIHGLMERMVREARRDARILSTHPGSLAMGDLAGLWELAAQRAREGVRLRVLLRTGPGARAKLAPMMELPGVALRHLDEPRVMRMVLVDDRELLLWVVSDPSLRLTSEEDVAIWSDAADFVGTEAVHFDALWEGSRDLRNLRAAEGVLPDADTGGVRP